MRQLRLVVTAEDYDEALRFYRDILGMTEQEAYSTPDGRVVHPRGGRATLELTEPSHAAYIDEVEVGRRVAGHIRVALEVGDSRAVTRTLADAGATVIAEPTRTPWNSLNARLEAPAGLQLTLFQELGGSGDRSELRLTAACQSSAMRFVCLADLHGYLPAHSPVRRAARRGGHLPDRRRDSAGTAALAGLDVRPLARRGARRDRDRRRRQSRLRRGDGCGALRDLDWHYLEDETVEIGGVSYFGSPWTSRFQDWAFMLTEDELAEKWSLIPPAIDVLCVHSPPLGYGDWISGQTIGSPSLLAAIDARAPKLCTFGHVHQGHGTWQRGSSTLVNAAYCGMDYLPKYKPIVVDLGL